MTRLLPLSLLSAAFALLLGACAPLQTGPQVGRIVSGATGEEGTVSFVRGSLRPRVADPFAPDNATIRIGGQTYTGRTVILSGSALALPVGWSLSVGAGGDTRLGTSGALGWGTQLESPPAGRSVPTRSGNLIARTAGNAPRTLTCTLSVDERERGIGECTDQDGVRYALQF